MISIRNRLSCAALAAAALSGCAGYGPGKLQPGQTAADVAQVMGPPTGRYSMPDGTMRLEYARGPAGRHTWMVDVDAAGKVLKIEQVLYEANFNTIPAGFTREQLLRELGRPSARRPGGWQGGEVWAWRYEAIFCTWFMASITDEGRVKDTAYGPDPACDDPYDSR